MNNGIRSLATLGSVATIVFWIFIASTALTISLQLYAIATDNLLSANGGMIFFLLGAIGLIWLLAFGVAIVVTALWVYRAHANLHEARLAGLNYNPGWATASFFVPLVNTYLPFVSTRELFNRSHGESDWHAKSDVGDVTSWVACNWGALVVFSAAVTYIAIDSIPGVHVMLPPAAFVGLFILLYLLMLGSAWFMMQIIRKVTAAQQHGMHLSQGDVFA
ncbi:DUF4328 domain-containing protein [Aurantiacibacter sp. MUD61]|uniref:DUF4328 domain-containing protein n=1 Tax=Aurantiacibacter sp. MUD61 TaxID=3009083 RepID=UPI0022F12738|nr:DUF4328 domain-containing protein [Aurantiacibacter sp. MUD61]